MESELRLLREIRTGAGSPGEPYLRVWTTGTYTRIWDVQKTKAQPCTLWRPSPKDTSLFFLGDHAQGDYNDATGFSELVQPMNDDPNNPLLKFPQEWAQMWIRQLPNKWYASIWSPRPRDGYVPLGWLGWYSRDEHAMPDFRGDNVSKFVCVRRDFLGPTDIVAEIWNDKSSRAKQDIALYSIKGVPNGFVGQGNYHPFSGNVFKLKES
jgi:hypothetical protein